MVAGLAVAGLATNNVDSTSPIFNKAKYENDHAPQQGGTELFSKVAQPGNNWDRCFFILPD